MNRLNGAVAMRAVREMLVIVAGVLIAFSAEAWWEDRSDRVIEAEILADLLEDLRASRDVLLADIEQNEGALEAFTGVFNYRAAELPADSLVTLTYRAWTSSRFDPVAGVLTSIVSRGQIILIEDADLRRDLASWLNKVEEARLTFEAFYAHSLIPDLLRFQFQYDGSPMERLVFGGDIGRLEASIRRQREVLALTERLIANVGQMVVQ